MPLVSWYFTNPRLPSHTRFPAPLFLYFRQQTFDKFSVEIARFEILVTQDVAMQRNGRVNALANEHFQGPLDAHNGFRPVFTEGDELGDERVIIRRNHTFR